jgi:lipopolysaccharide/colanic/teichoic acid biosynthesis glycosyltransferase
MNQSGWRLLVKAAVDRSAALVGLAVAAPVLLGAAVAVRATMGSPVLFRQKRPGRDERTFEIVKFRTMREATDAQGKPLSDAERLTAVGRWLRATSIDELPQLFNVLRGDLALVGPRPLLVRYLPRYSPAQRRRHEVMPGITGWAQIHGRNTISWEEKFALDVWYVEHWSLALDARILIETVGRVLRRDGVSSDGHATMPEFEGTPVRT